MRRTARLAILAPVALAALAAGKPGLVVRGPTRAPDLDESVGEALGEIYAENLETTKAFDRLVTSRDIAALLRAEQNRQLLGCDQGSTCLAELGGALGAEYLSLLDVARLGTNHVLSARLIEVDSARVLFRRSRTLRNLDAAPEVVRELAVGVAAAVRAKRGPEASGPLPPGAPLPAGEHGERTVATVLGSDAVPAASGEEGDLARRAREAVAHRQEAERLQAQAQAQERAQDAERARRLAEPAPDMVLVPAGEFHFGCNALKDSACLDNERPGRRVYLPAFKIDLREVTLAQYEDCVDAGACTPADGEGFGCVWGAWFRGSYPVNCVDWKQAHAYCAWKGRRLPDAREWEKAARGTDARVWPWGDAPGEPPPAVVAPAAEDLAAVGTHPKGASPYGALDMAGNVAEWTSSTYDERRFEYRGGGWLSPLRYARASDRHRAEITTRKPDLGFRCAL